jgi:hypothetical protein
MGERFKKYLEVEDGVVEVASVSAGVKLSQEVSLIIVKCAMEIHTLTAKQLRQEGMVQEDLTKVEEMSSTQQIAAGIMLLLSVILQMLERGGPTMQVTGITVVAEALRTWGNYEELFVEEILQGMLTTKASGAKLN